MVASRITPSFVEELLAEQQLLQTPVVRATEAFQSKSHHSKAEFAQLIPLSKPQPGEQYAFEVDLDACTGCKACVSACHSLNGLDDTETWRDVGMVVGGNAAQPFTQTVTTACHHCADPACLNGCPVLAYEKDPVTGIVRHLDDQCIGCSYCVLKCPYDVPKFNDRLGIVRKCDMCHGRLAEGEAPACAQACPTHAIRIVTVKLSTDAGRLLADTAAFLPSAPAPDYTQPTTRYVSRRALPAGLVPADAAAFRPQPAHWPLAVMLTLLPAAVGLQLAALQPFHPSSVSLHLLLLTAAALGALGLAASTLHLGQPLRAWKIFLGWRKSWLSREAMLFGAWFALTTAAALFAQFHPSSFILYPLLLASVLAGLAGLFCSAMLYADTRRAGWRLTLTGARFFGAALVFALAPVAPPLAAIALVVRLVWEAAALRDASVSSRLALGPLLSVTATRFGLGLLAAPMLALANGPVALVGLALALLADLSGLHLFFRTVDAPKMPGLPAGTLAKEGVPA